MTAKDRYGIEYLVEQIARSKDYETLVQEYVDLTLSLAELQAGISAGKQSRRLGKKLMFLPLQVVAADQYIELVESGKKVSAQRLFDPLKAKYPGEKWNEYTMRGWHKIFVAAYLESTVGGHESTEVEI
jgi:hypothetical protein